MKTGEDNWCSHCMRWQTFDNNGKCIKCGTFINMRIKKYSWIEKFGVEPDELNDGDF